jgi:hypothetical protein
VAQQTRVLYVDDIDGSEAAGTVRFGFDGVSYEIDLSKTNADQFADAVGPYVQAARRTSPARRRGPSASSGRHDQSEVRAWAREQGLKVSDRGRIPADILKNYEAAH